MSERRLNLVREAFSVFDNTDDGVVNLGDVRKFYDTSHHPDVVNGRKTENQVLREFLSTFETPPYDGKCLLRA